VERLERFKIRVKAELEPLAWRCLALRGEGAHAAAEAAAAGAAGTAGTLVLDADWPGLPGVDLLGPDPAVPPGVEVGDLDSYEALRVRAGVPAMGSELDQSTIPEEAGVVGRTVSFTKGCYTGQELVARIDSRGGNVPRRLRRIVPAAGAVPPPGATLHRPDGKQVGAVTSVAPAAGGGAGAMGTGGAVALGYVQRSVEPPADVELRWDGGSAPARVEALPTGD
jgi:folate-binding protein YgfZ